MQVFITIMLGITFFWFKIVGVQTFRKVASMPYSTPICNTRFLQLWGGGNASGNASGICNMRFSKHVQAQSASCAHVKRTSPSSRLTAAVRSSSSASDFGRWNSMKSSRNALKHPSHIKSLDVNSASVQILSVTFSLVSPVNLPSVAQDRPSRLHDGPVIASDVSLAMLPRRLIWQ